MEMKEKVNVEIYDFWHLYPMLPSKGALIVACFLW